MCTRFIVGACLLFGASAEAQQIASIQTPAAAGGVQGRRTMTALRIESDEPIVLDGRLDEEAWSRAVPAAGFVQQDPDNGKPATEQTEVRVIYTRDSLYMGVTCFDSEPDKWIGYQRRRDEFLSSDDRFMWNIDTFNNQQSGYFFEMNPSGLMGDALRGATFQNRQWDGIWNAKVRRSEIGWTVEIEIPFRTLNFDPQAEAWGINFQRTVRRKNEESLWTGWLRNQGLNRLSNAGLLTGLRDVTQGIGLDIKPYLVGLAETFPGRGDSTYHKDVSTGVDFFYSPVPRVRTNLTINTDFAQTEVDQRLVNLTRFPQFFPEKRDFFLDGSTFFDFQSSAQGGNSLLPYFSRRIGLDTKGDPQQVNAGAKLAGQFGRQDIGLLYVNTGADEGVLGEDFLVVRSKQRLLRQSYVGALYTGRNARDTSASTQHTLGADFLLSTSTFLRRQQLSLGGFFVNTSNPKDTGKSNAFGVSLDFPNDPWSAGVMYREIQENYNAAVGFAPRVGFRRVAPSVGYTKRPPGHRYIRTAAFGADLNLQMTTADNSLLNRDVDLTLLNVGMHSQDSLQVHVLPTFEKLDGIFEIRPGIKLPVGDYSWNRYRFSFSSAQRRVIAVSPTFEVGSFYNGTRRRLALDFNVRVRPGVIIYSGAEWNEVTLDQGTFQTRLFRFVPELQFSPWMAWVNNIQYDTQSSIIGWQSRFRWILRPGNDFYVVYTHNWIDDLTQNRTYTLDRRAATKVSYTKRF